MAMHFFFALEKSARNNNLFALNEGLVPQHLVQKSVI